MPRPPRRDAPVIDFDAARRLAAEYGTPLQVVDLDAISRTYATFVASMPGVEVRYAVKANRSPSILARLRELGSGADVCTPAEVVACRLAGFPAAKTIHTHPCKSPDHILAATACGVDTFVFESAGELDKTARYAPDAKLILRIAVPSRGAAFDLSKKFGCHPSAVPGLLDAARHAGMEVVGVSFHVGSGAGDPEAFGPACALAREALDEFARFGFLPTVLDVGGGFPAPTLRRPAVPDLADYLGAVWGHVLASFADMRPGLPGGLRVLAEPGRAMVAEAVTLVARVVGKSVRDGKPWYVLDDGIYGTFSGIVFDDNEYRVLAEDAASRAPEPCVLAGPTCDSFDTISRTQDMPPLAEGELLLSPCVGAYSLVSATQFNGFALPKVVAFDGDRVSED